MSKNIRMFQNEKREVKNVVEIIKETMRLKLASCVVKNGRTVRNVEAVWGIGMARRTTVCFCQTAPPRDRQDPPNPGLLCMRAVLAKDRWLIGNTWVIGCIGFSRGFLILILLSADSAPLDRTLLCEITPPVRLLSLCGCDRSTSASDRARCVFLPVSFSLLLLFGYLPFESFTMSLEDSDDLNIPDAAPVDPVLEAGAFPKFDMHLYRSSLNESHVRYLVKLYGIPEELHPRVVPEGMTMNVLPPGAIGLYAHHFQQGGLRVPFSSFFLKVIEHFCVHISQLVPLGVNRVTFFEMYCRSLDITPTVSLFRVFYKLCKQCNWFSFQNRARKNCKPCLKDAPTSLKKWKDKFFLVGRRAAPIAMAWRHHDSSVAYPFPKPSEYNASDVTKLREHAGRAFSIKDSEGKVITMAEFLRLPNFKGCKVAAGTLLPPGAARVTHLPPPLAARLEDIPPKTGDMIVAEMPCRKVVDDKERKKRKAEEKAATKAPADDIQAGEAIAKAAGREGPRKKRRVRVGAQSPPDSEHVSSPTPLNQAKPLEALANEEHVSPPLSVGRMGTLRDQTDEHAISPRVVYTSKLIVEEGEKVMLTSHLPSKVMATMRMVCLVHKFALALFVPPVAIVIS
ncbi:hypothetical protein Tco_1063593, partial [Tanacetum coccineum]